MSLGNGNTDDAASQSKAILNKWELVSTLLLNCRHFIVKLFQLCHIAKVNRF